MSKSLADIFDSIEPKGKYGLSDESIYALIEKFKREVENTHIVRDLRKVGLKDALSYQIALRAKRWKQEQATKVVEGSSSNA